MADKELKCSRCTNKMTFGGASRGMVKAMGGMKACMETMALNANWAKIDGKWVCRCRNA